METTQALWEAVKARDLERAKALIAREPALVDARNEKGEPAVLSAIYLGAWEIADFLIRSGATLDIFSAAAAGNSVILPALIAERGGNVNVYAPDGWTPLHLAAFFGHVEAARLLIEAGADVHAVSKNPTANTPLHAAATRGHLDVIELLLANGADVNQKAGGGWTPLHLAAGSRNPETVAFLLERGADVNATDDQGNTPLAIARQTNQSRAAELIRAKGGR
jgi:ankyrin repeat protein